LSAKRIAGRRAGGERKSVATRRRLLDRALALFIERGVAATTMRDIARAANLSLGAAYYYFPSKNALLFAYYEDKQEELEAIAARATGSVRERLGTILHGELETIRPHRALLASIVQHLVDPSDPLSAFSAQTRAPRDRAIGVFASALAGSQLPAEVVPLAAHALWLLSLGLMLVYINDRTPGETRTHGLVDDALDLIVPVLPFAATPMGVELVARITAALARADIALGA
jgi:AcrR family transcriptional regulator